MRTPVDISVVPALMVDEKSMQGFAVALELKLGRLAWLERIGGTPPGGRVGTGFHPLVLSNDPGVGNRPLTPTRASTPSGGGRGEGVKRHGRMSRLWRLKTSQWRRATSLRHFARAGSTGAGPRPCGARAS